MNKIGRRTFMLRVVATSCLLGASTPALADVDESDPLARALDYKSDTAKVDAAKFPNHTPAQQCNKCSHFQGASADSSGGCTLFAGNKVAGKGWCSSWAKKP